MNKAEERVITDDWDGGGQCHRMSEKQNRKMFQKVFKKKSGILEHKRVNFAVSHK